MKPNLPFSGSIEDEREIVRRDHEYRELRKWAIEQAMQLVLSGDLKEVSTELFLDTAKAFEAYVMGDEE